MSLRHKPRTACSIVLVFLLVGSSVPLARGDPDPAGLNFSLTVFEDTGTAGDRSDDTKISFSGLYSATYSRNLDSDTTRFATRFTKVGEMNKVRVCWEQGTSPTGTAYIRIETDAGGPEPSGTLADTDAEISVSASTLPDSEPEWCEYTFPGPVTLSESNWYWIVIKYEPSGLDTISVKGSWGSSTLILPDNINRSGSYQGGWTISTYMAYLAFVIPETGHSLPLYRRTTLTTELPVAAGLNQIANLPNDVNKVYRIVMQMQPRGDSWQWAPDDAASTDYYIEDDGSTPFATDIWDSDNAARPQFILQTTAGNGAKDDVFISGDEASEWDGKSSITLTECGDLNDASDPDATGQRGIYPYDGTQWWDNINDVIAQDAWQVIEFWFKLDDDWAVNDVAELRYWQDADPSDTDLAGLRYRLHVGVHQVDTFYSDYINPKDTYSLTETVYAKATGVKEQIGWLSGWGNRVKLTINSSDVDSDLSNFPVLVYLSTSSGYNNDDVSFVFDELQSDGNRKKIAVTKSDGTTECYVEIEDWDDASEEAWLWVKVSGTDSVSSSTDTDLFLYFDADHADNTAYVGDPNSTPAENVWDSNYVGVWHLGESSSTRYDSTTNDNDLTPSGTVTASSSGRIGSAASFAISPEGSLYITDNAALSITQNLTISAWTSLTSLPSTEDDQMAIASKWVTAGQQSYYLFLDNDTGIDATRMKMSDTGNNDIDADGGTTLSTSTWYYVTGVYDSTDFRLYLNDFVDTSGDNPQSHSAGVYDGTADFHIGRRSDLGDEMNGLIDEVRVSNTDRSAAWVKASYESGRDHLIDFGTEETQWLSGWGKRVKLTIDSDGAKVPSDLSDFPVVVHLSTSSGYNNDDVSFVFDELQSDASRKKIAVTKGDGTTQCYVEIEYWDHASEEAWLWVRVSGTNSISSSTDTDLYLYYDADHADNTAYVGDTDSTPAENVWDDYFKGVWHLHETNGATPTQHDSTSNNNDGTPTNTEAGDFGVSAKVDGAELFDGVNDYVDVPTSSSLDITGDEITIAAWANFTNTFDSGETDDQTLIDGGGKIEYWFDASDGKLTLALATPGWGNVKTTRTSWTAGTWYHLVAVYNGSHMNIYIDGTEDNSNAKTGNLETSNFGIHISNPSVSTNEGPYDGIYDEVRISNVSRTPAWVKASYNSETDDLIDFGSEESRLCDFRYYSDWTGTPDLEYEYLGVPEDAAGGWRNSYPLEGGDPTGTWGVRVYEAGTSALMCSASFTVQTVPEFPYGAAVALVVGFTFLLARRKTAMKRGKES